VVLEAVMVEEVLMVVGAADHSKQQTFVSSAHIYTRVSNRGIDMSQKQPFTSHRLLTFGNALRYAKSIHLPLVHDKIQKQE
jgi:hypothetical protein